MLPNIISISRIAILIPIAWLYPRDGAMEFKILIGLIIASYVSDYLDGFLARHLKMETRLGLILDPVADKIWTFVLIALLVMYRGLPFWIAAVIVARDLAILGVNFWLLRKKLAIMPSDEFGRKYMVLLGLMIIGLTLKIDLSIWLSWPLVVLAPINIYRYFRRAQKAVQSAKVSRINTGESCG